MNGKSRERYLLILGVVYALWWVLMAINPLDRSDWLLENVLVILGIGLLAYT
jgi:putative membrane protein